jgi:uncharacterized protein (UPF0332 family)
VNEEEARRTVVTFWVAKTDEALASARSEYNAGRFSFAVNRAYYACFYAVGAVFLREGQEFTKHSGIRGALHRDLIKTGRVDPEFGKIYDRVFDNRQRGDYQELVQFEAEQVEEILRQARAFTEEMHRLLDTPLL